MNLKIDPILGKIRQKDEKDSFFGTIILNGENNGFSYEPLDGKSIDDIKDGTYEICITLGQMGAYLGYLKQTTSETVEQDLIIPTNNRDQFDILTCYRIKEERDEWTDWSMPASYKRWILDDVGTITNQFMTEDEVDNKFSDFNDQLNLNLTTINNRIDDVDTRIDNIAPPGPYDDSAILGGMQDINNSIDNINDKINNLEATNDYGDNVDINIEQVVFVADYSELENIESPSTTTLYVTQNTGEIYEYQESTSRNEFVLITNNRMEDDTICYNGNFNGLSELLKNYIDTSIYKVILIQSDGTIATYRFCTTQIYDEDNEPYKIQQTLSKDQRDGTSANVRTRTGRYYSNGIVWSSWKLRTPLYKEELDTQLNANSDNAVTNRAVTEAINKTIKPNYGTVIIDTNGDIESYPAEWDEWNLKYCMTTPGFNSGIIPIDIQQRASGVALPGLLYLYSSFAEAQVIKYESTLFSGNYTYYRRDTNVFTGVWQAWHSGNNPVTE